MINVGIIGASGYTGVELCRILLGHSQAEVVFATSETYAGRPLSEVHPKLRGVGDLTLLSQKAAADQTVDLVFSCLPHKTSMAAAAGYVERGVRVVDLSADFRMDSAEQYERWYGAKHVAPKLLPGVYGLPEINRALIANASLVANPGCYPTGALLGLIPLAEQRLIEGKRIIVDAKSGISGAGRKAELPYLFVESSQSVVPYSIGHTHRHIGELEQELGKLLGETAFVVFTPHRVPTNQGILSTMYVDLKTPADQEALVELYARRYDGEPFVRLVQDYLPETRYVIATNFCDIGLQVVPEAQALIVVTAVDNLVKGAAGQAVQNMNIMFGLDERTGLLGLG